jgi:hypothetical protein
MSLLHPKEKNPSVLEQHDMAMGSGGDPVSLTRILVGAVVGIAGALAMWFNEILNGEAEFSVPNFLMLCFVGATIGGLAIIIAPMFHVDENYTIVFSCAAAASHKYIFRTASWFLDKWTKT